MCWNAEASAVLACAGFIGSYIQFKKYFKTKSSGIATNTITAEGIKNKHCLRGLTLSYFALMETLQIFNYLVINTPGFLNSFYTFIGYIHISFQPIFITLFMLSFIPIKRRFYWFKKSLIIGAIASSMMLLNLVTNKNLPGCFAIKCTPYKQHSDYLTNILSLSSPNYWAHMFSCNKQQFLSYMGDWHIAWQWVLNSCGWLRSGYIFTFCILPVIFGAYRAMIFSCALGPVLAISLTSNHDEWPAIWCLLSIAFILSCNVPFLEKILTNKKESWRKTFK